jgi:NAD(P)-dependent dehydrogenase (short-subunit alcohol dehydrogenase family)
MPSVWFITGRSRGIGLELAKAVLAVGHRLVATARRPDDLAALVTHSIASACAPSHWT